MTINIKRKTILDIAPYVPGKYSENKNVRQIKLSSNENPFGASPKVKAAVEKAMLDVHRYPDGACAKLIEKLCEVEGFSPNKVIFGAGSDEVISFICYGFCDDNAEVIHSEYGFLMYPISANSAGAKAVVAKESVNERGYKANVDEILKVVTDKTRIVFLANPNNPTGSFITKEEILKLRNGLREDILLVLDCAYDEYALAHKDFPNSREIVDMFDNVIMLRTFSKAYGIPALRLGYGYGSEKIIDILNRVRGPFNVSSVAQSAGIAALEDKEFVERAVAHNTKWLKILTEQFKELGLKAYDSIANFILVDFGSKELVQKVDDELKNVGITGRRMDAYKLPTCIRFSIGLEDENAILINEIRRIIK